MQPIEPNRHDKAADAVHDGRPVKAEYVRSGGSGKRVLPILVISLTVVVIVLLAVTLGLFKVNDSPAERGANSSAQEPAAVVNTDTGTAR